MFVHYLCAELVMVYVKSLSARCQKIRSIKCNTIGNTRGIFCTALITFRPFSYRNSDHADGGSHSRVCARTLDPPLAPPHRHERKFSGARVCRSTFKHSRRFGTLGQLLEIPPLSAHLYQSAGVGDVPNVV